MNASTAHFATLCRYAGISFIAGAVNHGFFSGERSLLTAAIGVLAYLFGGWLEMRAQPEKQRWLDLLGVGIVSSIGLGFFTGGLQHFPDSPARSAWVVPLGFAMSAIAFWMMQGREAERPRAFGAYAVAMGLVVVAGSIGAWRLYESGVLESAGHDHAAHDHAHDVSAPPRAPAEPSVAATREVLIEMDDTMRFTPNSVEVTAGEPVRMVIVNRGKVPHELVIGTPRELAEHAREMKSGAAHHHHGDGAVRVLPGERAQIVRTFAESGELGMACFEPGHYEAGMKGTLTVRPRS